MKRNEALKLIDRLIVVLRPHPALHRIMEIRDQIDMRPMSEILNFVPGKSARERALACKITTSTYYSWMRGESRPLLPQARKLSALTGYSIAEIRGSAASAAALAPPLPLVGQGNGNHLPV